MATPRLPWESDHERRQNYLCTSKTIFLTKTQNHFFWQKLTWCEYHSETKRSPDLLRTNFCWECQCSEKATFHCKTCCKGLCYLHGQITPSALEIFSREGADGCRTCIGLKDFQKTRSEAAQALLAQLVGRLDISVFWFAVSVFWFAVSVFWFAVFVCLPQNISRC